MYMIVNPKTDPFIAQEREEADNLLSSLKRDQPAEDWKLYSPVSETTPDALERLYGLCDYLLRVSKVDPTKLQMNLTNMAGDETTYTAMKIMIEARQTMDEIESYPDLLDAANFCIEKCTDEMIRARLKRALRK